jgi:ribulose-phosphate 3-epimerase
MIERPGHYLDRFLPTARNVTLHVESSEPDLAGTLRRIRAAGCTAGISVRPGTPFEAVEPYLEQIDLFLVMTVEPGFGGQSFQPEMLAKIETAAAERERRGLAFHIQVDGGISAPQAKLCIAAGANVLVAGTSVFGKPDYAEAIRELRVES